MTLVAKHSFRDPVTGVLTAWGFVTVNAPGEVAQVEAADFNLQPGEWQWDGAQWIAFTPTPDPDKDGFEVALHDIFPGQDFFAFWAAFPLSGLFLDSIRRGTWPLTQALIGVALQQGAINQQQYDAIKAAAAAHHIPVSL